MKFILIISILILFGAGCAGGPSTKPINAPVPNTDSGQKVTSQDLTPQAGSPRVVEVQIDSKSGNFTIEPVE